MPAIASEDVPGWLRQWAVHIRHNDPVGARALFSPDCAGFGTVAFRTDGLEPLAERQWRRVWGRTRGFDFDLDHVHLFANADLAVATVEWKSSGLDKAGDTPFDRKGRATIVLRAEGGALLCCHTHFSTAPLPERLLETP